MSTPEPEPPRERPVLTKEQFDIAVGLLQGRIDRAQLELDLYVQTWPEYGPDYVAPEPEPEYVQPDPEI